MTAVIRPAAAGDAAAICDIHNQGIVDRVATLETALRTIEGTQAWLAERSPRHPVIVAELDGTVAGWASLNRFNPRAVYDAVADFSVYVARDHRGRGIGKLVLAALADNAVGVALYTRAGFSHVGVYREHGQLDGRWVNVVIMERLL
jgi:phosphinothricin acetyltransferase